MGAGTFLLGTRNPFEKQTMGCAETVGKQSKNTGGALVQHDNVQHRTSGHQLFISQARATYATPTVT